MINSNSRELIKINYEISAKYILMIIIPLSIGIFFYARLIIDFIYSNQYSLASTLIQIIV
nr:oligosaccharide flippase family protein [Methanobrevibacter ruminantium]